MITVRNADTVQSVSARASTADLQPGMIVAFVQGTASGEQPKVRKATAAEIIDATVMKGVVDFIPDNNEFVDFDVNTVTGGLTAKSDVIPVDSQVNVWMGPCLVIAYSDDVLPSGLKSATVREASKVGFDGDTAFPGVYASGATDGLQSAKGMVYRVDGPEVTLIVSL